MAEDNRVDPPEAKPTVSLPAVPQWAVELTRNVKEGFKLTNSNLEIVSNDLTVVKERVTILETERAKFSGGVRNLSLSDATQNQELSNLSEKVSELGASHAKLTTETAKQTLMLSTITDLLEKPLVRRLGYAVAGLMLAALTSATGYLARGNVPAPQPTIIQVAPVAPATLDGGSH